jgi:hypothetical protein
VARPEAVAAEYPYRPTREEETVGPAKAAGLSSIAPGGSRPTEKAKVDKTTTPRSRITPRHSNSSMKYSSSGVPKIVEFPENKAQLNKGKPKRVLGFVARLVGKKYLETLQFGSNAMEKVC